MRLLWLYWISITLGLTLPVLTMASVIVYNTRVVITDDLKGTVVKLANVSKENVFLVQSYITHFSDKRHATKEPHIPFIITPPIFRMEPGQENIIRILYTGEKLPEDRESVFHYHVKAIPQIKNDGENKIIFAIDSALKLFYRPKNILLQEAREAYKKLTFSQKGKELVVRNPTPYHITLYRLSVGQQQINHTNQIMLSPFGEARYSIKPDANRTVSWSAVGDLSEITPEQKTSL